MADPNALDGMWGPMTDDQLIMLQMAQQQPFNPQGVPDDGVDTTAPDGEGGGTAGMLSDSALEHPSLALTPMESSAVAPPPNNAEKKKSGGFLRNKDPLSWVRSSKSSTAASASCAAPSSPQAAAVKAEESVDATMQEPAVACAEEAAAPPLGGGVDLAQYAASNAGPEYDDDYDG